MEFPRGLVQTQARELGVYILSAAGLWPRAHLGIRTPGTSQLRRVQATQLGGAQQHSLSPAGTWGTSSLDFDVLASPAWGLRSEAGGEKRLPVLLELQISFTRLPRGDTLLNDVLITCSIFVSFGRRGPAILRITCGNPVLVAARSKESPLANPGSLPVDPAHPVSEIPGGCGVTVPPGGGDTRPWWFPPPPPPKPCPAPRTRGCPTVTQHTCGKCTKCTLTSPKVNPPP